MPASRKRSAHDEPKPIEQSVELKSMPTKRYIGSFGVGGWATRSGTKLLLHGQSVKIERQKITVKTQGSKKATVARRKTQDIVVRFTNPQGQEVGRLPQDTAEFVSTLIDQGICSFEGVCVYAPEQIRTNDTIYLQLRCFMLREAFEKKLPPVDNNVPTEFFSPKETEDERAIRLRQVGLVKLFAEVNLEPVKSNGIAQKHKRTGILQAAELAENGGDNPPDSKAAPTESQDEAEEGKELEQDQLDALYKKAQSFDFDAPEAEPANTFAMDLRPYQKQALHWLLNKEKNQSDREDVSMHPLWEEYIWPTKDQDGKELPWVEGLDKFYVNPYMGELSIEFPRQEQNCLGGILADEMGLGKTIEMLSLVHSNKYESDRKPRRSANGVLQGIGTTLVVAPMSLLSQWELETVAASKEGTLRPYIYYGNEKKTNLQTLLSTKGAPDVMITSYGTILSEYTQISKSGSNGSSDGGLFSVCFYRIILDEAHHIKNRLSKTSRACYELMAEHRWCLTGTPIVNRLEDLFSLVKFLRVDPWQSFSFWKTFITMPFENKEFLRALDVVQTVLEPLVLRRTKDMKLPNGEPLVPLPPKTIVIVKVQLSKSEREVYDHIQDRAKRTFKHNLEAGTLMKSYTSILAQILRLRQSCCHPNLIRKKEVLTDELEAEAAWDAANGLADDMDLNDLLDRFASSSSSDDCDKPANSFPAHVLQQIKQEVSHECPFCCSEPMESQSVTSCFHAACRDCWKSFISHEREQEKLPLCPNCREPINERDIFEVVRDDEDILLRRVSSTHTSSKITSLIKNLKDLHKTEPITKSTVFSQFTSFLDLIEGALTREKIPFLRFDGSMQQQARKEVIEKFKAFEGAVVLLISLRAGGVGLNLTEARRVFMMDPWWSFAVEAQAIDRVHRMGQTQEVTVHRFVVEESVEERMVNKIQARKKFIASSLGMMSDEEKKQQRIDDIKDLLSD
ncbi:SNF2 family N-terminal domain-containing protein [Trichophaea hybrida]|nr:SNF2 family N-terminal domain-containing protein [Trichophaea hybrida]